MPVYERDGMRVLFVHIPKTGERRSRQASDERDSPSHISVAS